MTPAFGSGAMGIGLQGFPARPGGTATGLVADGHSGYGARPWASRGMFSPTSTSSGEQFVSRIMDNRGDRQGGRTDDSQVLAAETLRNGSAKGAEGSGSDEKGVPVIWRIFGGTLLSISALVAITLYQQLSNRIENNHDALVKKVETISDTMAKKQEFFDSRKALFERIEALRKDTLAGDIELRQRSIRLEEQLKASDDKAKDMARSIQILQETLASYATLRDKTVRLEQQFGDMRDERARLVQDLQQVRERIASVEGRTSASSKKSSKGE
jgi:hypothetical protein